jgi:hypothetical protein
VKTQSATAAALARAQRVALAEMMAAGRDCVDLIDYVADAMMPESQLCMNCERVGYAPWEPAP